MTKCQHVRAGLPKANLVALAADHGNAAVCDDTLSLFPEVDILINNLGIYEALGFFDETDDA